MRSHDESTPLLLESQDITTGVLLPTHQATSSSSSTFSNISTSNSTSSHHHHHHAHRRPRSDSHASSTTAQIISEIVADVKEELIEVLQEDVITPIKPRDEGEHSYKLSAVALAVMVFYKVSGGPFGCEPTVKAAGPFYALLGFIFFPILWSIPEAFITAELGSAYPEPSGRTYNMLTCFFPCNVCCGDLVINLISVFPFSSYFIPRVLAVAWVEEAFGSKASLMCGYFHWISGATDNAIYPSLFLKYFASYIHSEDFFNTDLVRFTFTVGLTIVLSTINYSGLHIVGNLSIVISIISMSPFVIMVILAIPKIDTNRWTVMPIQEVETDDDGVGLIPTPLFSGVHWRPLLNNLFWNLNSFDVGASFAGEVRDPEKVFPRAMFMSIVMVVLSYIIPLLAALGATDSKQDDWDAGYLTTASVAIGGSWLGAYTVLASAISNIALFEAEMSGDAYQLMGMADRGLIPKWFAKRSRFDTPVNGIFVGTLVIVLMSVADFDQLVEMLNFAYSFSYLMEFAAFVKLRITDGDGKYHILDERVLYSKKTHYGDRSSFPFLFL